MGLPGALVSIELTDGSQIGATVVEEDGFWAASVTVPLTTSLSGVIRQSTDDDSTDTEFSFTVGTLAPATLTSPAEGAVLDPGTMEFSGTGQPGAFVRMRLPNGSSLGSSLADEDGNWRIPATVPLTASFSVEISQSADGYTTRTTYRFTVKPAPEIPVTLSSPEKGAVLDATVPPTFRGVGQLGGFIVVQLADGSVLGQGFINSQSAWSVSSTVSLAPGSYTGTVTQIADGKITTAPFQFTVKKPEVVIAPVTLTGPTLGAALEAGKPTFTGKGHPGATVTVKGAYGTVLGTGTVDAQSAWSIPSTISLAPGSYTGTVTQIADGKITTAPFEFTVKKPEVVIAPVTLTGPTLGAALEAGKPAFTGKGHPGATVTVKGAYGTVLGTGTVDAQSAWSIPSTISLAPGSYTGTATQTVDGKTSTAPFQFTVKKPEVVIAPVTLTGPTLGSTIEPGKPLFTGKGTPAATVTVRGTYGTVLGTGTVGAQGAWSIESTVSLAAGYYTGTATQTVDGKTSTAPFQFTVK